MNNYRLQVFAKTTPIHLYYAPEELDVPVTGVFIEGESAAEIVDKYAPTDWKQVVLPSTDAAMAMGEPGIGGMDFLYAIIKEAP